MFCNHLHVRTTMTKKILEIDGKNFKTLKGFYSEADRVLTFNLNWKTGHNLDAFNDLLRGGFGVHEYFEPIQLIWKDSAKSKRDLSKVKDGMTLYDTIVDIIKSHDHIEFIEG